MEEEKKNNKKKLTITLLVVLGLLVGGILVFSNFVEKEEEISVDFEGEDKTVASVNGDEITGEDVLGIQEEVESQGMQMSKEEALEELINRSLVYLEAKKGGFVPNNDEAEEVLESMLSEQGLDLKMFKQQISEQGVSYEEELSEYKRQIAIQDYLAAELDEDEFKVSQEEAMDYYESYSQQFPDEDIPSYEDVESQIIQSLEQQKQQESIRQLVERLRIEADVVYY